jgi:general secretion pathway protein L
MSDFIGLDIGHTAIKAVRFRRRLSGRETVEYFHQRLPPAGETGVDQARVAELLRAFVRRHNLASTPVVSALACQELFLRTLTLPFDDPEKLAQVAPFELENLIPLSLDEVAVGCVVLGKGASEAGSNGSSDVLVAAAPRATVTEHIKFLSTVGIDPALVNVDALALFAVTQQLRREGANVPADLAIIDLGATKTTVCLTHQHRPWLLRSIPWGGEEITSGLIKEHNCTRIEAEKKKRSLTVEQLERWMTPLVKDVQLTLHAYEAATHTRLCQCWLSGGGAKLQGAAAYLARQWELEPVGPREGFGADCPRVFSVAFGLAVRMGGTQRKLRLRRPEPDLSLNLKQAIEVTPPATVERRREMALVALGSLLILVLGLTDLWIRITLKENQLRDLRKAVQTEFSQAFGTTAPVGSEVEQGKAMLARMESTIALLDGSQTSPVPMIAELVRRLPKTAPLKVIGLMVEGNVIRLEAETLSFDAVEKVKQALLAAPTFRDVVVSDARVGVQPSQVLFRVSLTVSA